MEAKSIQLNICYACMKSMPEESSVCPACGNDNRVRSNPENTLPEGTVLFRKYLVGKMIGRGGFGVTYIGYDLDLQLKVAIKEYFPAGVSIRSSGSYDVISDASTTQDHTAFSKGCEAFLDEARMLASVNSPYIVHVRDFFREHGTAYIVMDYVEGITLTRVLQKAGGRIEAERVVSLMLPLIEQLDKLHEKNIIHRDIKPENIMLVRDWFGVHLILLDFGAARSFVSGNVSKTFTAVVTPGFAPPEQYSQKSRQGAFTDVYGLCATMYYAITGTIPPTATERSAEDIPIRSFRSFELDVPQHIERAIIHGLALKSADRTQTMQALYAELSGGATVRNSGQSSQATASRTPAHHAASRPSSHVRQKAGNTGRAEGRRTQKSGGRKIAVILLALFIVAFAGTSAFYLFGPGNRQAATPDNNQVVSVTSVHGTDQKESLGEASQDREVNLEGISVGNYVTLGAYEQDNDFSNGSEPIEWLTLDIKDNQALLISNICLDNKPFNDEDTSISWDSCSLKKWLNNDFYQKAFAANEQSLIQSSEEVGTVFLLSTDEAKRYFKDSEARKCGVSEYAQSQGAIRSYTGNTSWWLRTNADDDATDGLDPSRNVQYVDSVGIFPLTGRKVDHSYGVRPAIWISLDENAEVKKENPAEITSEHENVQVGSYVTFGTYEQDGNPENGMEPIEWLILEEKNDRMLLITRYGLDCKKFNNIWGPASWENCSLRTWLNNSFLNKAFSLEEQKQIHQNETGDNVFLLSSIEAKQMFVSDAARQCKPTEYAKAEGCFVNKKNGNCWWWLRSQGANPSKAAKVLGDGSVDGGSEVYYAFNAVRPAMWINVSAITERISSFDENDQNMPSGVSILTQLTPGKT